MFFAFRYRGLELFVMIPINVGVPINIGCGKGGAIGRLQGFRTISSNVP